MEPTVRASGQPRTIQGARAASMLVTAAALAGSTWLPWYERAGSPREPLLMFGSLEGGFPDGSIDLWTHRPVAAVLLLAAAVLAAAAAFVRSSVVRGGTGLAAVLAGTAGLLVGRDVASDAAEANYVLRGYGATVYSGVFDRDHAAPSTVLVATALAVLLVVSVLVPVVAGRRARRAA